MKISLTQHHIDNGNQASDFACALALAFADAGFSASVGIDQVSFYHQDGHLLGSLPMPADARFWNNRLDMGQKVEPFTFEMPELDDAAFRTSPAAFESVPVV